MTTAPLDRTRPDRSTDRADHRRGRRFLAELEGRSPVGHVGPQWFSAVMGTGIVAVALDGLPVTVPGTTAVATAVWLLAATLLVVLLAATAAHHLRHPAVARGHLLDPVLAPFHGAPAMALLTVGVGSLLLGPPLLGEHAAVVVAAVLWTLGTLLGLVVTVLVPLTAVTRHDLADDSPSAGWLVAVVPPMVSAATGALLVPHVAAGQARDTLLLACGAMFGVSLLAGLGTVVLVWGRLLRHGPGAAAGVPTTWIVLGVLGQSVTAAHHLAEAAAPGLPAAYRPVLDALVLAYGVPVWGFALAWLALATALTVRTARAPGGLPFALTWWSFTFPLGTVVTGTSALAALTGLVVLQVLAVLLAAVLVAAWAVVAARTVHGTWVGRLLLPPAPVGAPVTAAAAR